MKEDLRYFAAANTSDGFISYYDGIFGKLNKLYVIKGGPGTGKSRLMKEIGESAEKNGNIVEYFYCSFDPTSLDGIIINQTCAVIDGTAPHVYEPRIPGAVDETVDLCRFWNADALGDNKEVLTELNGEKSRAFRLTYLYLAALGKMYGLNREALEKCIRRDMFKNEIHRRIGIERMEHCRSRLRISSAFGREGIVSFPTYNAICKKKIELSDTMGTLMTEELLNIIMRESKRQKVLAAYSYAPMEKNKANALLLSDDTAILAGAGVCDYDVSEFMRPEIRHMTGFLEENREVIATLISCAERQFVRAAEIHSEIEKIYVSAMDFEKKEKFTGELIEKIVFC